MRSSETPKPRWVWGVPPGGASPGPATSFQIGSVTKVFTSLLLADAVQRGDLALDQRLDSIFPGTATHPEGRPITLVDLATHTSGLPRLPPGMWRRALRKRKDPYSDLTREQVAEALRRLPKRSAGRRYVYSKLRRRRPRRGDGESLRKFVCRTALISHH